MKRQKNILCVTHNDLFINPRGGEFSVLTTLEYLSEFGYNVYVLSRGDNEHFITKKGIRVDRIPHINPQSIKEHANVVNADIMITWGNMIPLVNVASKLTGIPFSMWSKSLYYFMPEKQAKEWDIETMAVPEEIHSVYRPILSSAKNIWGNCEFVSNLFKKHYNIETDVNYVPVEIERLKTEAGSHILLPLEEKLNKAMIKKITDALPDEKFLIPTRQKSDYTEKNVEYVTFLPKIELFNKTKLMLYPKSLFSEYGTSRTIIEALQNGIPVIGNGKTGIEEMPIVKSKDTAEDYIKNIKKVLKRQDYYSKKARKDIYLQYNWLDEVEKVRQDIDKVVNKGRHNVIYHIGHKIGIGNIIQTIPSIKALVSMGYKVDILVTPTYDIAADIIRKMPYIDNVYIRESQVSKQYDLYLAGHFAHKPDFFQEDLTIRGHADLSKHESDWYMQIPYKLGYKGKKPCMDLFFKRKWFDLPVDSTAFAPDVWASWRGVKKWNGYKELSNFFYNNLMLGYKKMEKLNGNCINYTGKTNLNDCMNIINQSEQFIGNDTGLAHVSAALRKETYVIFGSTSPIKNLPPRAKLIQKGLDCQPCQFTPKFKTCKERKCLSDLTAGEVLLQINKYKGKDNNIIINQKLQTMKNKGFNEWQILKEKAKLYEISIYRKKKPELKKEIEKFERDNVMMANDNKEEKNTETKVKHYIVYNKERNRNDIRSCIKHYKKKAGVIFVTDNNRLKKAISKVFGESIRYVYIENVANLEHQIKIIAAQNGFEYLGEKTPVICSDNFELNNQSKVIHEPFNAKTDIKK